MNLENDFGYFSEDNTEELKMNVDKLKEAINMILPLLDNLSKNPEVDTIYWPNRVVKIQEFREKLLKLLD